MDSERQPRMLGPWMTLALVIGGYNSSNTISLAAICAEKVRTFHIEDASAIDPETGTIRYRPPAAKEDHFANDWMPQGGTVQIGVTAGASTPNNKIGDAVARIFATRGVDPARVI